MDQKRNILIIIADQLTWKAIPAYGNTYCKTPNIDRIFKKGVAFDKAITPFPLCQPARASFWTSLYPHETGIDSNGRKAFVPTLPDSVPTLGSIFSDDGYDCVHFGKKHDAGALRGFTCEPEESLPVEGTEAWPVNRDTMHDRYTAVKSVEYLEKHGDEPFVMVADFVNPHDICSWIGANKHVHTDVPVDCELPPLPENFDFSDIVNRPKPVQYICCSHNRQSQTAGWTEENFRYYLAAYYHYVSRVDAEIGLVLDALEKRADADNTLIVFMADHGDGMASRGMVTKQVSFYDETTRVPFIFAGPDVAGEARMSKETVSLLDLVPTLCDYAGLKAPDGARGVSLMPWLKEARADEPHEYVASEWHTEWAYTIEPGRMITNRDYKYVRYVEGDGEEFYDLNADPLETRSLINDPAYAVVLGQFRAMLEKHVEETGDKFFSMEYLADDKWRSHPVGYQNHVGPAAPMMDEDFMKKMSKWAAGK